MGLSAPSPSGFASLALRWFRYYPSRKAGRKYRASRSGSKYQVLDTSILDTKGEQSEPIPARRSRAFARGIVAEPPVGAGLAPARARSAQRVMERIARREPAKRAKRLAQIKKILAKVRFLVSILKVKRGKNKILQPN